MLDAKRLRSNFDEVKAALAKRNKEYNLEKFIEIDKKRRELLQEVEELKNKQNVDSKQVPILKKEGKDVSALMAEMKELS
ncbi:MAG: serine--tRNA ligase, partial [Firmicutes bacterium]|nr:serine--tRNA ligase [Bacillota bacterium]